MVPCYKFHSLVNSPRWPSLHLLYAQPVKALYTCKHCGAELYGTMMRPFETTEPAAPIVAKHCGRGRQIGRIGPIWTFANSDIKSRSCLGIQQIRGDANMELWHQCQPRRR